MRGSLLELKQADLLTMRHSSSHALCSLYASVVVNIIVETHRSGNSANGRQSGCYCRGNSISAGELNDSMTHPHWGTGEIIGVRKEWTHPGGAGRDGWSWAWKMDSHVAKSCLRGCSALKPLLSSAGETNVSCGARLNDSLILFYLFQTSFPAILQSYVFPFKIFAKW